MEEILHPVSVGCVSDEDWAIEVCPVVSFSGPYEAIPILCEGGTVEDYMFAVLYVVVACWAGVCAEGLSRPEAASS